MMKQIGLFERMLFWTGGLLLLIGVALPLFVGVSLWVACVFGLGCLLFAGVQFRAGYSGSDFTVKRLRRLQLTGAFALFVSAALLFAHPDVFAIRPIRGDEWKVALAIAAVFEVYTAFRLPVALSKANG